MPINVLATGPYPYERNQIQNVTSNPTYTYFSGLITTTDDFNDTVMDFGVGLKELWIVNVGANALAFQFPELYDAAAIVPPNVANTASGMVPGNDKINFRNLNKRGIKVRSLITGSQTTLYIFGV